LKVIKSEGDEWRSGAILEAFGGRGMVRVSTVQDWGKSFATAGPQIPRHLVDQAREVYFKLCASQSKSRLLHGDLHHG